MRDVEKRQIYDYLHYQNSFNDDDITGMSELEDMRYTEERLRVRFPNKDVRDQAYRVRAQVDVLMPGGGRNGRRKPDGTLLKTYGKKDGITLGEMQEVAKHVLSVVLDIKY